MENLIFCAVYDIEGTKKKKKNYMEENVGKK